MDKKKKSVNQEVNRLAVKSTLKVSCSPALKFGVVFYYHVQCKAFQQFELLLVFLT